ncbi:MAG: hypothetical protein AB4080_13385 [Trichodesmium sp.]
MFLAISGVGKYSTSLPLILIVKFAYPTTMINLYYAPLKIIEIRASLAINSEFFNLKTIAYLY